MFLYKSTQGDNHLRHRFNDYFILTVFTGWICGASPYLFLPLVVSCMSIPRKYGAVQYFTFHAELLPHTEQVVFHKAALFGGVKRQTVDIKNLEKIDAGLVPVPLMWDVNMFDDKMVFRDQESKECFVFDKNGVWNKDALEHPLLF